MHEKRFDGGVEKLRSPVRIARLEVERVVDLCLAGAIIQSVLDVGTGSGLFAEAFLERGLAVVGIDANPDMLPVAGVSFPKPISARQKPKNYLLLMTHSTWYSWV